MCLLALLESPNEWAVHYREENIIEQAHQYNYVISITASVTDNKCIVTGHNLHLHCIETTILNLSCTVSVL